MLPPYQWEVEGWQRLKLGRPCRWGGDQRGPAHRGGRPAPSAEARSQEQEQQIADLRQQVVHQQAELETARILVADHARLSGERTAVRQQLHDQATLIDRLTARDR